MIELSVDFQALSAASSQIGAAADGFGRCGGQVAGSPRPPGGNDLADRLLERALSALGDALAKARAELDEVSSHLAGTVARYESTERALASWKVPGGTA